MLSETMTEKMKSHMTNLLCLMIYKLSMLNSKILTAAEGNIRQCIFKGQNSKEFWGEIQLVLWFGDNYQLFPVIEEGAIQRYSRMSDKSAQTPTTRMTATQLLYQHGIYLLLTHVMTETDFMLDKNYRVKCKKFCNLLGRLRIGESTHEDAEILSTLNVSHYDVDFTSYLENNKRNMWLNATNADKELRSTPLQTKMLL